MAARKGILERLAEGPVIGDGGFCFGLEKRGYVKAGPWTPECVVKHTEAVKQYHREFLRSGADVMQAYTFYATDSKLDHALETTGKDHGYTGEDINMNACRIAREVAAEGDALFSGSLSETPAYKAGEGKQVVQEQFRNQLQYFIKSDVDIVICEYYGSVEEMEWAIEVAKESKKPVAATMCIGPHSDHRGVPTGECAVRMAKAGADIIGVNCNFGPYTCLKAVQVMKQALDAAGLKPYLMIQPLAYYTPEIDVKEGYLRLPEAPYALEVRAATRFELAKWARECYEMGIHYIGGCCGFEPYHIRAISEELTKERGGKKAEVTKENGFLTDGLVGHYRFYTGRDTADYWKQLIPATGRPHSSAHSPQDKVDMQTV